MGDVSKEVWQKAFEKRRALYLEDPQKFYNERYFVKRLKMRAWEMQAGGILSNFLNIKSMIDFGCAWGSYLEGAFYLGKTERILGIDICYDHLMKCVPEYMRKYIIRGNVGRFIDQGKWDCAFSIETAEHLLPEEEGSFLENLVRASFRLIVMTAAFSYNLHHLNPGKPKEYWVERMESLGCRRLEKEEKELRTLWKGVTKSHIRKKLIVLEV